MSGVRVLTYNVQCRSWAMEALAQGSPFPEMSTEERAREISRRILDSYRTWDIVCLNEVFDDDARDVFILELGGRYPHQVQKCDVDYLGVQLGIGTATAVFLAIPGIGWLAGLGIAIAGAALLETKFEDSGLMIFSRFPFEQIPIPAELAQIAQQIGAGTSIPKVAFVPYEDSAGADALAAKGALYAAIDIGDEETFHLLVSHTQADPTDDVGKHADIRRKQLDQALGLLELMVSSISNAEILFCGDLNIDGTQYPAGARQEWVDRFLTVGSRFHDDLIDAWHREQCPGDSAFVGVTLPAHFDRGATAGVQRLDYLIRTEPPFIGRLVGQHLAIPYEVADNPDRTQDSMYTSDHRPLSIDLHAMHARATVMLAQKIAFPDPPVFPAVDEIVSGTLESGQMHWFRIDERGAYGLRLEDGEGVIAFEVYTADNLSVPHRPFSLVTDAFSELPHGTRFALPSAPFFIRVFQLNRHKGSFYRLRIHRFLGTSEEDAIPLLRGIEEPFTPKEGAPHSLDRPFTSYDEHDTVWFVAPFDTRPDGSLVVTSTVTVHGGHQFGLLVLSRDAGAGIQFQTHSSSGQEPVVATLEYDRSSTGFFLVQRETGSPFPALPFTILLESDVSYLYSRPAPAPAALVPPPTRATRTAELFCVDETDGLLGNEWGSDDMQVNVSSDGMHLLHIPHTDDLAFDDDSTRTLPQLDGVRYVGGLDFELVELDDLSAVDRASVHIPPYAAVAADPSLVVDQGDGSTLTAKFRIVFDAEDDDGIYELTVNVSQEPPPQTL
jgi:Endonuclease/Exonuclease/phosphatase family